MNLKRGQRGGCLILRPGEEPLREHGIPLTCIGGPFSSLRIDAIIRGKRVQICSRPHSKWICVCLIKGVTVTSNVQKSAQVAVVVSALLPHRLGCSECLQDFFFLPFPGSLLILWILPCGGQKWGAFHPYYRLLKNGATTAMMLLWLDLQLH